MCYICKIRLQNHCNLCPAELNTAVDGVTYMLVLAYTRLQFTCILNCMAPFLNCTRVLQTRYEEGIFIDVLQKCWGYAFPCTYRHTLPNDLHAMHPTLGTTAPLPRKPVGNFLRTWLGDKCWVSNEYCSVCPTALRPPSPYNTSVTDTVALGGGWLHVWWR